MPDSTSQIKESPAEKAKRKNDTLSFLERQIRVDLKAFSTDFKEALSRAETAAISGWQIGKALLEAKALIPHGDFEKWLERFEFNKRTSQRFMEKAREYPELKDFVANRREAILSTGLLPDKPEIQHGEDNVSFPSQGANHLRFVNRFNHWLDGVKSGTVEIDQTQVKTDLRPLYDWLKGLYGE